MFVGTMTSKGQITIPAAIRERVGLGVGVRVEFTVTPEGNVQLWPLTGTAESFFTALDDLEKTEFSGTDDEAIAMALTEPPAQDPALGQGHMSSRKPRISRPRARTKAA